MITITVEGATPQEIEKGLEAARAVFAKAGVTPERAAEARFNVEGWDIGGFQTEISEDDLDLCGVWDEADKAAVEACCAGWDADKKPASAKLELADPHRNGWGDQSRQDSFDPDEILHHLCEKGYFDEGLPEDTIAYDLAWKELDELCDNERRLYDTRIAPLAYFENPATFEAAYRGLRNGPILATSNDGAETA